MDFFLIFSETVFTVVQYCFYGKYLGCKTGYPVLPFAVSGTVIVLLPISQAVQTGIILILMYIYGAFVLRRGKGTSLAYAAAVTEVMQFCRSISDSCFSIVKGVFSLNGKDASENLFTAAGTVFPILLFSLSASIILKKLIFKGKGGEKIGLTAVVLIPGLLMLIMEEYISTKFYFVEDVSVKISQNVALLAVLTTGLAGVFCTLYAYKKIITLVITEQQNILYKQYAIQARERFNATVSLRHDINNHLTVLDGLLERKEYSRARDYLARLRGLSVSTSPLYHTGCEIIDILLDNISAEEVAVECDIFIPSEIRISDEDICAIFANALDNAIAACAKLSAESGKFIRISGKNQGEFLLITFTNPYDGRPFEYGTGLGNIISTVKKYNGSTDIKTEDNIFTLSILLRC